MVDTRALASRIRTPLSEAAGPARVETMTPSTTTSAGGAAPATMPMSPPTPTTPAGSRFRPTAGTTMSPASVAADTAMRRAQTPSPETG